MGLSAWEDSLAASVEKFELGGVSPTELAVIVKNHCSNGTASEGLGFKIDEIVQAWNEMYDISMQYAYLGFENDYEEHRFSDCLELYGCQVSL
ncbi:hypothetical protein OSB04_019106 [Centaurea solstitialis]|uniref:Uncharacterized protein n=1 Tax=Centaurea solstitialis TaxID=347529 RepID=A0AA38T967_9ASTR|nr:hypothetical protein OSB04_019106 [Centaurea solstitialis]